MRAATVESYACRNRALAKNAVCVGRRENSDRALRPRIREDRPHRNLATPFMTFMKKTLLSLLCVLVAPLLHAVSLHVATLNCYLCFDPSVQHAGHVDDEDANRLSPDAYRQKIANLASLTKDCQLVGLQEVGGEAEVAAIAKAADLGYAFVQGKDTFTGENVGLLYRLPPGWKLQKAYRHPGLDSLSKHLVCDFSDGREKVTVVVFHLIRPVRERGITKHARQLSELREFATTYANGFSRPILFLGDSNRREREAPFPVAADASPLINYGPTHLDGQSYDRMFATAGAFSGAEVTRPPYGRKPSSSNKRIWTDHFLFSAEWDSGGENAKSR